VETGAWTDRIEAHIANALALEDDIEVVETILPAKAAGGRIAIYIYRTDGVRVEDCARINRRLSRDFEHDPELAGRFAIEVSSPGLDRKLTTRRDFERAVGELLRLVIAGEEEDTTIRHGILTDVGDDYLLLDPSPEDGHGKGAGVSREPFRIPLETVREGTIEIVL